jgi:DNA-binding transcriptional MerR regulator
MNKLTERTQLLTRGALAAEAGCGIETIRNYEQIGIMPPPPPRSVGGHRLYGHPLVKRLHFIRRSRELGFTLREIRQLLRLVDGGNCTCARVETLARERAGYPPTDRRSQKTVSASTRMSSAYRVDNEKGLEPVVAPRGRHLCR